MDPKFFSGAQQGIPMTAQQAAANARMMMALQQQQQNPQSSDPSMQQYNAMAGAAMGNMGFSGAANLGSMAFAQGGGGDMSSFDQSNFMFMNQVSAQQQQQQQPFVGQMPQSPANMQAMNLSSQQQLQQTTSQHPQASIYASQAGMMPFAANANNGGLQQQNRAMYQGGENMMSPTTPQAILLQQQQQQQQQQQHQAAMMNRVKQSPSQSPAMNNAHFQGSPVAAGSPHVGAGRMPTDYSVSSPMVGSMSSPVQGQTPGMNRVIPSQAIGRYMQHMNASQQAMMQGGMQQNIPSPTANVIRQIPPQMSPQIGQSEQAKESSTPSYGHPQSPMQKPAGSPAPRRSATPGSATSTPLQQHRQIEQHAAKAESPGPSMEAAAGNRAPSQPPSKTETPSPKPSPALKNEQANSPSAATATPTSQPQPTEKQGSTQPALTTYVPKTRNVDTYGGVDLKYFDKFDIKPMVPHFGELGIVDIHALIMSLKSGMKMEVTNALNTLTVVTSQHTMSLVYCEDLLDILLDYMEKDVFGECSRFATATANGKVDVCKTRGGEQRDLTYAELFDMSLDEMKSLIPMLEETTSDLWLSLRERCLCIFNIFRNLSFMPDNMEYLARHERFVSTLGRVMDSTRNVEDAEGKDTSGREAWFVGVRRMDTLDFRKSVLLIFSNIAMLLHIRHPDMAGTFVRLTHDFLTNGPDTYYAMLAAETWAKVSVNYENRKTFARLADKTSSIESLQGIWMELAAVVRRDFFMPDGKVNFSLSSSQLAMLEYAVMGLYSIAAILTETSDERQFREQLFLADRTVPMMILRLCVSFGESGVPNFQVATKRGMELVRRLVFGADLPSAPHLHHRVGDTGSGGDDGGAESHDSIVRTAHRMLDMSAVRHMLMMAMLRPHSDAEMLRDLSDMVTLIDGDNADTPVV